MSINIKEKQIKRINYTNHSIFDINIIFIIIFIAIFVLFVGIT